MLLDKLDSYGVRGSANMWVKSYLTNRTQFVEMSQTDRSNCTRRRIQSSPRVMARGVPNGSILGSLLCLVYINDLPLNIHEAKLVLYADDTNILVTGNDEALQAKLSSVMKQLEVWFLNNDHIVNTTKTVTTSFHLCQSKPPYKPSILLQNNEIPYMSEVKFFRNVYHGKSKLPRSYLFSVSEFE
jgi:sarcosine oxidase/L-pipecolate oxidase